VGGKIWPKPVVDASAADQPFYDRGVYHEISLTGAVLSDSAFSSHASCSAPRIRG
jgi:hypothetical protein